MRLMSARVRVLSTLVVLAAGLLAVLWWMDAQPLLAWNLPRRAAPPMLIIAHRGDTERFPEDTAEAIWSAANMGADGIEFDVHQSADGTWWVIHDATVDRTTNGSGAVRDLTDEVLARLQIDGGTGFPTDASDGIGLSKLSTILDGLSDYEGRLYIDLQHAVRADPTDLARQLSGWPATVICRSLDDAQMVSAASTSVSTMIRADRIGVDPPVDSLLLEAYGQATISAVASIDLPVATYIDGRFASRAEDAVLRRAWAAGVDAFLTKDLAAALALRQELRQGGSSSVLAIR